MRKGDRYNKEFFNMVRLHWENSGVKRLRRVDGSILEDSKEMKRISSDFYANLLTMEDINSVM